MNLFLLVLRKVVYCEFSMQFRFRVLPGFVSHYIPECFYSYKGYTVDKNIVAGSSLRQVEVKN